jgi:hypothetical protein
MNKKESEFNFRNLNEREQESFQTIEF